MDPDPLGVIFDMDGVLVDSTEAHYASWCILGEAVGRSHPREFFRKTFGMHNREIIPLWLGSGVSSQDVEELSTTKEALYRWVARRTLRPLRGSVALIEELSRSGFRLAVGSSGPRENVELSLSVLGVRERFAAFSTGGDVSEGKPHPEVFLKAAERLGVPPERCAVVEDAPQGVEAGLRAGARVIAVTTTRDASELQGAHLVVRRLEDLSAERVRRLILEGHARDSRGDGVGERTRP